MNMQAEANKAPAIVTGRQPYLFTNALDIGPEKKRALDFLY